MKRLFLFFILIFGLSFFSSAQILNITGNLSDEEGQSVADYEVLISTADSTNDFFYSNILLTDEEGIFNDVIELPEELTQGGVLLSVVSCNEVLSEVQYFFPGNMDLEFNIVICRDDSTGGGNDTLQIASTIFIMKPKA